MKTYDVDLHVTGTLTLREDTPVEPPVILPPVSIVPVMYKPLIDVPVPLEASAQWPANLVNDYIVSTILEVPQAPTDSAGDKIAIRYKWRASQRYFAFTLTDTGAISVSLRDASGYSVFSTEAAQTVGAFVEIKMQKSSTEGFLVWVDNVLIGTDSTKTAPHDEPAFFDVEIGHYASGNGWDAKVKCFAIHSGNATREQAEGIVVDLGGLAYPILDDHDYIQPPAPVEGMPDLSVNKHPMQVFIEGGIGRSNVDSFRKYDVAAAQATSYGAIQKLKDAGHKMLGRTLTPFQDMEGLMMDSFKCAQGFGHPFIGTTDAAGGMVDSTLYGVKSPMGDCEGGLPASWWVYRAGTNISASINTTEQVITVGNVKKLSLGYAMICDKVGDFARAEHIKITRISGNTLTVVRGYLSNLRSHAAGSYIAKHQQGDDGVSSFWQYNMSTQCPLDSKGRQANLYMADWLAAENAKSGTTNFYTHVSGIRGFPNSGTRFVMYDVDRDYLTKNGGDCNNDGIDDMGYGPEGQQWWIDGNIIYYDRIAELFPTFPQVGGVITTANVTGTSLNGTQLEGPTGFGSTYSYKDSSALLNDFFFREKRTRRAPAFNHILFKQDSLSYDVGKGVVNPSNAPVRLWMAAMTMAGGYFHHQALRNVTGDMDLWYDEYSVNLDPNHPTLAYGQSPIKSEVDECIKGKGWLGDPKEDYRRIFDPSMFNEDSDLLKGNSVVSGWESRGVPMMVSGAVLMAGPMHTYNYSRSSAYVESPRFPVVGGREYTVTFTASADMERRVSFRMGSHTPKSMLVSPDPRRYIMTFRPKTADTTFKAALGRQSSGVNIEDVQVHEGTADTLIREFDNGIVVVNFSKDAKTVSLGTGSYQRILGSNNAGAPQDPAVNNGAPVNSAQFTIPPFDAVMLVRTLQG